MTNMCWCSVCRTEIKSTTQQQVRNSFMLIIGYELCSLLNPTVNVKCKTAIQVSFLYFNICRIVTKCHNFWQMFYVFFFFFYWAIFTWAFFLIFKSTYECLLFVTEHIAMNPTKHKPLFIKHLIIHALDVICCCHG